MNTKWCKITKYGISVQVLGLQGWCAARTTHCDSGYDVTIGTYSLPHLYRPQMKNAFLMLQSLTHFLLLVLCDVRIRSHPLNEQQDQITLLDWGKLWFSSLNGECLESIVLPWKCYSGHIMELCDECNNCTKFQLFTCGKICERYSIFTPLCAHKMTSHVI